MHVQALKGFGVYSYFKRDAYKPTHIRACHVLGTMIIGRTIPKPEDAPKSFWLLIQEPRTMIFGFP
jgi:DNA-directed RNA polymerase subunit beta